MLFTLAGWPVGPTVFQAVLLCVFEAIALAAPRPGNTRRPPLAVLLFFSSTVHPLITGPFVGCPGRSTTGHTGAPPWSRENTRCELELFLSNQALQLDMSYVGAGSSVDRGPLLVPIPPTCTCSYQASSVHTACLFIYGYSPVNEVIELCCETQP